MGGDLYRWCALVTLVTVIGISGTFRRRARAISGTIPRQSEQSALVAGRLALGLPLFVSVVAYLANPRWMAWAAVPLPAPLRGLGVALGALVIPGALWVLTTIGENISETVLTKERHTLVTHGPYRWVRHPLYTVGTTMFVAIGLMAANWFILAAAAAVLLAIELIVIPLEERQLIAKFGNEYRMYQATTGRMIPIRWRRS